MAEDQPTDIGKVIANGIRLAGDTLIAPGSSQILDGKVGSGLGRFAIGAAARAVLGPIGWLVVGLDSYAKTTTGRGLLDRLTQHVGNTTPAPPPAATVTVTPKA
jgi:hypothetical protein